MAKKSFVRKYIRPLIPFPKRRTILRYFPSFATRNVAFIFRQIGIDTIIDVGANTGQFAIKMRSAGFKGRMISFEPIAAIHEQLVRNAARDRTWEIAPRMALGSQQGEAVLNIMGDHSLSSFLEPIAERPVRKETVPVKRLDTAIADFTIPKDAKVALKVDVQGFEPQVFEGASQTLARAKAIFIEVSLRAIYVGEENYLDMLMWLRKQGFHAVYFCPVLNRKELGEAGQMDVLLVRRG